MSVHMQNGETFGTWLARKMREAGITQTELAAQLGATQGMVSNWVNDKKTPTPRHCDGISAVLAVDVDEVLTRAGHRPELATDIEPSIREAIATMRQLPPEDHQMVMDFLRWRLSLARQRRVRPASA